MSTFTHDVILELIRTGRVKIEPFSEDQVGPASIDLHLGSIFRVFKEIRHPFDVTEEGALDEITETVTVAEDERLLLLPGKSCLGITVERVTLPSNICGWLEGRSRFARLGIVIHATASFIQPGIDNRQVLEITNHGQMPLNLVPGVALCQLILQECVGSATYRGRFTDQLLP